MTTEGLWTVEAKFGRQYHDNKTEGGIITIHVNSEATFRRVLALTKLIDRKKRP